VQVATGYLAFSCASVIVRGNKQADISKQPSSTVPAIISVIWVRGVNVPPPQKKKQKNIFMPKNTFLATEMKWGE
jgi:hypothetical protein